MQQLVKLDTGGLVGNESGRRTATTALGVVAVCAVLLLLALAAAAWSSSTPEVALPVRDGPRTVTSYAVPHVQHFVDPVGDVDSALRSRIESLPGIDTRESIVSIAGTVGLWLGDELDFANEAATLREREFAHLHPDGSLHLVLPIERALEATETKWAELHPWVGRDDFWDGMVMLYTPQSMEELEVTWQLIVDSYNFVTDQRIDARRFR